MYILGIETSCDETAASIIKADRKTGRIAVLSNIISTQIEIHKKYGGVVPEVAAREHVLNILPVIDEAFKTAKIKPAALDLIAVTKGPGLITSLIAGMETVRSLAFAWDKPVLEINHIEGHIYSNFISPAKPIKFPAMILTVSGGHTNLVLMDKNNRLKIIGETLDDAAGEAYDKGAKMMGLGYPGGPIISAQAEKFKTSIKLQKNQITPLKDGQEGLSFPRPMLNSKDFNFSFSGLKTALLYQLKKDQTWKKCIPEYCYAYQQAIIDILVSKTIKASRRYDTKTILLSGGVSANKELRVRLAEAVKRDIPGINFLFPALEYTTDNATMVATAAFFRLRHDKPANFSRLGADPGLQLK